MTADRGNGISTLMRNLSIAQAVCHARELMFASAVRAPLAILRLPQVFGLGTTHSSYGPDRLRLEAATQGRITLLGGGEETRDFIHIDDLTALTSELLRHRSVGLLNAVSGESLSYRQLAELIASQFGELIEVRLSPRQRPVTHRRYDASARRRAFPRLQLHPLAESIAAVHRQMMGTLSMTPSPGIRIP